MFFQLGYSWGSEAWVCSAACFSWILSGFQWMGGFWWEQKCPKAIYFKYALSSGLWSLRDKNFLWDLVVPATFPAFRFFDVLRKGRSTVKCRTSLLALPEIFRKWFAKGFRGKKYQWQATDQDHIHCQDRLQYCIDRGRNVGLGTWPLHWRYARTSAKPKCTCGNGERKTCEPRHVQKVAAHLLHQFHSDKETWVLGFGDATAYLRSLLSGNHFTSRICRSGFCLVDCALCCKLQPSLVVITDLLLDFFHEFLWFQALSWTREGLEIFLTPIAYLCKTLFQMFLAVKVPKVSPKKMLAVYVKTWHLTNPLTSLFFLDHGFLKAPSSTKKGWDMWVSKRSPYWIRSFWGKRC